MTDTGRCRYRSPLVTASLGDVVRGVDDIGADGAAPHLLPRDVERRLFAAGG
jgi:hypothetical protein